jgi:hypothetical protein
MIYIRCEAMPSQRISEEKGTAGAFVNCWVNTEDAVQAEGIARQWIANEGWTVVGVEEVRAVSPTEGAGKEGQYIREAREHGGSMVFHKWAPAGEPPVG